MLFLAAVVISVGVSAETFGQDQAPSGGAAPVRSGVTTVQTSSNILEYGIVLALFGGALYAVCRSSHRN